MRKSAPVFLTIVIAILFMSGVSLSYSSNFGVFKNNNYKFGASFMTMNNNFYKVIEGEIKNQVEINGDDLITLDPALNAEKQIEQIDYLIEQNVDVIFVTPIDYQRIMPSLIKAKESGIYIVVVDAPVIENDYIDVTVVSDNYKAGVLCAQDLMKKRDTAKILLLEHNMTMSGSERIQGFKDTIAGFDDYEIAGSAECHGQIEDSFPITSKILETHSDIDVIFALNDPSAIGALAALEKHGMKDCLVYGVDGTPDCKMLIYNQKGMTATVAQFPIKIGKEAIESAYKLLKGIEFEKEIIYPVELIDETNVGKYDIGGWQ